MDVVIEAAESRESLSRKRWIPAAVTIIIVLGIGLALLAVSIAELESSFWGRGLGSASQLGVGQTNRLQIGSGSYVVYENSEDATFPVESGSLNVGGPDHPVISKYTAPVPLNMIPTLSKTTYEGVAQFSVPQGGLYVIVAPSGTTPLLLARSPGSIADSQFGWFVVLAFGVAILVFGLTVLVLRLFQRKASLGGAP